MSEELKLAIEMWQEIVNKCKSGEQFNVVSFKKSFCEKHRFFDLMKKPFSGLVFSMSCEP